MRACVQWVLIGTAGIVLQAAPVQVRVAPDGVHVRVELPAPQQHHYSDGRMSFSLPEGLLPADTAAAALPSVGWLLALPDDGAELAWEAASPVEWSGVRLASTGELFGAQPVQQVRVDSLPRVQLHSIGRWRGVRLAALQVQLWAYESSTGKLRLWRRWEIRLTFRSPLPKPVRGWRMPQEQEFLRLLNPEHYAWLAARAEAQPQQRESVPFPVQQPVLRLRTRTDGVAIVTGASILQLMPEWRGVDSRRLHLLWRGRSVPILLTDRDGVLSAEDTLFFFGRRAAGDTTWFDFYDAEESFFLSLADSAAARYVPFPDDAADTVRLPSVLELHWERDRTYVYGINAQGDYSRYRTETAPGEGWYWAVLRPGQVWQDSLLLPLTGDTLWLELFGYSFNGLAPCAPEHRWRVLLNADTLAVLQWSGIGPQHWRLSVPVQRWAVGWNRLRIESFGAAGSACGAAEQGLDAIRIRALQQPVATAGRYVGEYPGQDRTTVVRIDGFRGSRIVVLDTLGGRGQLLHGESTGGSFAVAFVLPAGSAARVWAADSSAWEVARLERIEPLRELLDSAQADAIVLTVPRFFPAARRWAEHRQRRQGLRTRIVSVEDVAIAFGWGRRSPHAIKAFLRYAYRNWKPPAPYVLLILGTANWDARNVLGYGKPNVVPSYGVPVSDYWYGLLEGEDFVPEMLVGRLPAADSLEAERLVDKTLAADTAPRELWRKRALFLFGYGFYQYDDHLSWARDRLGMRLDLIVKESDEPSTSRYGPQIRQLLSEGIGFTSYFGHGAEANMELQGWEPQRLDPTPRLGILMTLSCSMGNFATPYVRSYNEQYVALPQRGFAAALGMAGIGFDVLERSLQYYFFQALVETRLRTLGALYLEARRSLTGQFNPQVLSNDLYRATLLQHTLLGDPLLRFPVDTLPDLALLPEPVLHSGDGRARWEFTQSDTALRLRLRVGNLGIAAPPGWSLQLLHRSGQVQDTLRVVDTVGVAFERVLEFALPQAWLSAGEHRLQIRLNADSSLPELDYSNNSVELRYRVFQTVLLPLEPLPCWNVGPGAARFRVLLPTRDAPAWEFEAQLWRDSLLVEEATEGFRSWDEVVQWEPSAQLEPGGAYRFRIRARRSGALDWSGWLEVPFWVDTGSSARTVHWRMFSAETFGTAQWQGMQLVADSLVRLEPEQRRLQLQMSSDPDPLRATAVVALEGQPVLELRGEAGIGVVLLTLQDSLRQRVLFYRTGRAGESADAAALLALLRDSVRSGEVVALVLSGDGLWRLDSLGLEQLRQTLRSLYGAALADSLQRDRRVAYALLARRGAPRAIAERWKLGDTLRVDAVLSWRVAESWVQTPWIGPAQQLGQLRLRLREPYAWEGRVLGRSSLEETGEDLLALLQGDTLVELRGEPYAYVRVELHVRGGEQPALEELALDFVPQGELALRSQELQVSQQPGSDTLQVRFGVWNRALRAVATPVRVQMSTASAGVLFERTFPVEIPPDTLREFVVLLPSTGWALQDTLSLRGWSPGELYAFNDRAAVPVQKQPDQEPPKLELWWQQEETVVRLQQGMSIERRPRLWAILQDNLPLLSAARALTLWIDGRRMDSTTAEHYRVYAAEQFAQLPEQIRQSLPQQARVVVECLPRLLPPGTVLLRLVGEDAAGLRDTLALELLVTTERRILLQRLFPQPGGDELRVDFLLQSYHPQERVRAELFDLTGRPVWSEEFVAFSGSNRWSWSGRDQAGRSVGSGVYLWRLWIPEMGSATGISGMWLRLP